MRLKSLFITILTVFVALSLQAKDNDNIFKKLSENKNITTVVVSKTLLRLSGGVDMGFNIKDLSKKLDKIEIYNSEDKSGITVMKQVVSEIEKDSSYEELMNIKDDGETTIIYAKTEDGETFKEMILLSDEGSECSLIRMKGSFSLNDVQGVVGSKK